MTHKAKALGLALMAMLAMSAVVAQGAQGQAAFTAESVGATIKGTQIGPSLYTFSMDHGLYNCTTATLDGMTSALETSEQTLTPTYAGCKVAGLNATVNMTGCDYLFTAESTESPNTIKATVHLKCPVGQAIDIKVVGSLCEITIGPQTNANGILLHNNGTQTDMDTTATWNVTGITYTVHNPERCPFAQPANTGTTFTHNGTFTGQATTTAESFPGGWSVDITVH